jgi:hypothetical protein
MPPPNSSTPARLPSSPSKDSRSSDGPPQEPHVLASAHTALATGIPRLLRAALAVIMRSVTSSSSGESYLALALVEDGKQVVSGHVSSAMLRQLHRAVYWQL